MVFLHKIRPSEVRVLQLLFFQCAVCSTLPRQILSSGYSSATHFSTKLQLLDWTQCYTDSILGSSGLHKWDTFKLWGVGLYPSEWYTGIPDLQRNGSGDTAFALCGL